MLIDLAGGTVTTSPMYPTRVVVQADGHPQGETRLLARTYQEQVSCGTLGVHEWVQPPSWTRTRAEGPVHRWEINHETLGLPSRSFPDLRPLTVMLHAGTWSPGDEDAAMFHSLLARFDFYWNRVHSRWSIEIRAMAFEEGEGVEGVDILEVIGQGLPRVLPVVYELGEWNPYRPRREFNQDSIGEAFEEGGRVEQPRRPLLRVPGGMTERISMGTVQDFVGGEDTEDRLLEDDQWDMGHDRIRGYEEEEEPAPREVPGDPPGEPTGSPRYERDPLE